MPIVATASNRIASLSSAGDTLPGKIVICLAATAIVAAAAHVSIPLPFTPVPLTLQPLAVLGVGLALGPVAGFFTMLAYLAEGAIGLPVFSPTGPGGIAQLLGPTGGFLMSYPLVAAIAGGVTRTISTHLSKFSSALVGGLLAITLLFIAGAGWLMSIAHLSAHQTWIAAIAPFLPGEIVKVFVAAGVYSALTRAQRIQ